MVFKGAWVSAILQVGAAENQLGHWSTSRKSSFYFVNDRREGCAFRLTGTVAAMSPQRVDIQFQGKAIWSDQLGANEGKVLDLRLDARPGRNYLYLPSDCSPDPPPGQTPTVCR